MKICFHGLFILLLESALHVQCWSHKINPLSDVIKKNLPAVNELILSIKARKNWMQERNTIRSSNFYKRRDFFRLLPNIPVQTHWNSWPTAVKLVAENFEYLYSFIPKPLRKLILIRGTVYFCCVQKEKGNLYLYSVWVHRVSGTVFKPFLSRYKKRNLWLLTSVSNCTA